MKKPFAFCGESESERGGRLLVRAKLISNQYFVQTRNDTAVGVGTTL